MQVFSEHIFYITALDKSFYFSQWRFVETVQKSSPTPANNFT